MKIITDDGQEFTVETVKSADLGPGDIVVIRSKSILSQNAFARIKSKAEEVFPGAKTVVLDGGLDIEILRQKTKEAE